MVVCAVYTDGFIKHIFAKLHSEAVSCGNMVVHNLEHDSGVDGHRHIHTPG
jgi:hypothetical protein